MAVKSLFSVFVSRYIVGFYVCGGGGLVFADVYADFIVSRGLSDLSLSL